MNKLETLVYDTIKSRNMISEGDKVVVGLSGGADSSTLLYVLCKLKSVIGFEIVAAHLNHGIRGEEALRDMRFSEEFAKELGVDFCNKTVDTIDYASKNGLSVETAGRKLRYDFFDDVCTQYGCNKIAVAHNKNDRAETIIMNLIRGCGANGLEGIKAVNESIIRPLIDVSRNEIEEYASINNINFVTDSTNNEDIYTRNMVRNKIISYMKDINPNVVNNIIRTADIISDENDYINSKCAELCPMYCDDLKVYLSKKSFRKLNSIEKRRVILSAIEKIVNSTDNVTYSQIVNALKTEATGKEIHFANGVILTYTSDKVVFSLSKDEICNYCYQLKPNEPLVVKETNTTYLMTVVDKVSKEKNTVYISADDIDINNIMLRSRNEGDIFKPSGLDGKSKKVKKYFIDSKIPADERNNYPLLVCNDKILAIIPLRVSYEHTVSDTTKKIIKITIL